MIGQNLDRRGDRTKYWEEESRVRESGHEVRHQVRHAESFLVSHDIVVKYRLIEMG